MKKILYITVAILALTSCKKEWLDVKPSGSVEAEYSIQNLYDAGVALNGAYSSLQDNDYYGADLITYAEVKGEDMRTSRVGKRTYSEYLYNHTTDAGPFGLWSQPYITVSIVNNILANIDKLDIATSEEGEKDNLKGQAYALRALALFDLTRTHGMPYKYDDGASLGVPIILTELEFDAKPSRNTVAECYEQIIKDLNAALEIMPVEDKTKSQGRINTWTVKALLSRVYLYMGDDANALKYASEVIEDKKYSFVEKADYSGSWAKAFNNETIFEIVNTDTDNADREAVGYLFDTAGYNAVTLTDKYISMLNENMDDVRNEIMIYNHGSERNGYLLKYPGKEGASTIINNIRVIRIAEVNLNAAEAAMKLGNTEKAAQFLNEVIVARMGDEYAVDQSTVSLDRILLERRKELVGEGHRFFDAMRDGVELDRSGADQIGDTPMKIDWSDTRIILPIPRDELNVNPNIKQNPGYLG